MNYEQCLRDVSFSLKRYKGLTELFFRIMVVELHCVADGSKVRVRIAAYIDDDGKKYPDVYNNAWNCRFSRELRSVGRKFLVPDENVRLQVTKNGVRFYSVSTAGIRAIECTTSDVEIARVYEVSPECVVCMENSSEFIFAPCGHFCTCNACGKKLQKCCICRVVISAMIPRDDR
jgi:hypothetical protein